MRGYFHARGAGTIYNYEFKTHQPRRKRGKRDLVSLAPLGRRGNHGAQEERIKGKVLRRRG